MRTLRLGKMLIVALSMLLALIVGIAGITSARSNVASADTSNTVVDMNTDPTTLYEGKEIEKGDDILEKWLKIEIIDKSGSLNNRIKFSSFAVSFGPLSSGEYIYSCYSEPDAEMSDYVAGVRMTLGKEIDSHTFYAFICPDLFTYINDYCTIENWEVTEVQGLKLIEMQTEEYVEADPLPSEKTEGFFNNVADWVNENTGFAITSGFVSMVAIAAVVYALFFKRRR